MSIMDYWQRLLEESGFFDAPNPRPEKQCEHYWSHRNDGKVSVCRLCGKVRDNEP